MLTKISLFSWASPKTLVRMKPKGLLVTGLVISAIVLCIWFLRPDPKQEVYKEILRRAEGKLSVEIITPPEPGVFSHVLPGSLYSINAKALFKGYRQYATVGDTKKLFEHFSQLCANLSDWDRVYLIQIAISIPLQPINQLPVTG
jgi:hypothetical protein